MLCHVNLFSTQRIFSLLSNTMWHFSHRQKDTTFIEKSVFDQYVFLLLNITSRTFCKGEAWRDVRKHKVYLKNRIVLKIDAENSWCWTYSMLNILGANTTYYLMKSHGFFFNYLLLYSNWIIVAGTARDFAHNKRNIPDSACGFLRFRQRKIGSR